MNYKIHNKIIEILAKNGVKIHWREEIGETGLGGKKLGQTVFFDGDDNIVASYSSIKDTLVIYNVGRIYNFKDPQDTCVRCHKKFNYITDLSEYPITEARTAICDECENRKGNLGKLYGFK
jgi:hypothetical protein